MLPADSKLRKAFTIQNPLGEDTSVMRTTSLPSMLDVLSVNTAKRNMDVKLFELATVYLPASEGALPTKRSCSPLEPTGRLGFLRYQGLSGGCLQSPPDNRRQVPLSQG
jgi:phenylalanyl-tRNA synthetase beta chain